MIVSHRHRFIFIKTRKTAGTSIEIALSPHCGPEDIISPIAKDDEQFRHELGYPGPQHYLKDKSEYGLGDWWQRLRGEMRRPGRPMKTGSRCRACGRIPSCKASQVSGSRRLPR